MGTVRHVLKDGTVKTYRYERKKRGPKARSIGALVREYQATPEYKALRPETRKVYQRAIDHTLAAFEDVAIADLKRRQIIGIRNKLQKRPAIADQFVSTLSVLMRFAVEMEYRESTPTWGIGKIRRGEHRRWSDDQIRYALDALPERYQRAVVLGLYTGQREGDCLRMLWSDYDGEGINVVQEKTGEKVWIPCHSALKASLRTWKRAAKSVTILSDLRGRPWRVNSFCTMMSAELRSHEQLAGLVFHGLRKTAAAKLGEAGCSTLQIAAITGHRTLAMVEHYTREAEQKARATAAIVKLESLRTGQTGQKAR